MAVVSVWLVKPDSCRESHSSNADITVFKNLQGAADKFTKIYIQLLVWNLRYDCGNFKVLSVNKEYRFDLCKFSHNDSSPETLLVQFKTMFAETFK